MAKPSRSKIRLKAQSYSSIKSEKEILLPYFTLYNCSTPFISIPIVCLYTSNGKSMSYLLLKVSADALYEIISVSNNNPSISKITNFKFGIGLSLRILCFLIKSFMEKDSIVMTINTQFVCGFAICNDCLLN